MGSRNNWAYTHAVKSLPSTFAEQARCLLLVCLSYFGCVSLLRCISATSWQLAFLSDNTVSQTASFISLRCLLCLRIVLTHRTDASYLHIIPTHHTYTPHTHIVLTHRAYISYLHIKPTHHTYILYLRVVPTHHTYTPHSHTYTSYWRIVPTYHTYTLYLHIIPIHHTSYLHIIPTHHTYTLYLRAVAMHRTYTSIVVPYSHLYLERTQIHKCCWHGWGKNVILWAATLIWT